MNRAIVGIIFRKELLDTLRDKRTLVAMIGVPIFLYPILVLVLSEIAVTQSVKVAEVASRVAIEAAEDVAAPEWFDGADKIELVEVADPDRALAEGAVDVVLRVERGEDEASSEEGTLTVTVAFDTTETASRIATNRVEDRLRDVEKTMLEERLERRGLPDTFANPFVIKFDAAEEDTKRAGFLLGTILPMIVVLMMALGGFYPAVDLTAGEKERGTFETLLSTPATKLEILTGKFLTVSVLALITGLMNVLSSGLTIWIYLMQISEIAGGDASSNFAERILSVPPERFLMMVVLIVPLALTLAALMMAVAVLARSFKDAQNYLTPLFIAITVPAALGAIPDFELTRMTRLIPIGNVMLLTREMMMNQAGLEDAFFVLLSTTVYALLALLAAVWMFQREEVILSQERGLPLTLNRAAFVPSETPTAGLSLGIFALVMLLIMYAGSTAQAFHLHAGLALTEWVLVLCPVLGVLWFTRVRIGAALNLRRAPGAVWIGTLLLLPGWVIIALQVGVLNERVLPAPEMLEEFSAKLIAPAETLPGLVMLLFLIGVSPAICEEALFRGALVSGLRERLSQRAVILVTAILFGLFHLSIYRFVPTAATGLVLTYVCVRGGSILPAVVFHGGFNSALLLMQLGWVPAAMVEPLEAGGGIPLAYLVGAAVVAALGIGMIERRARTAA